MELCTKKCMWSDDFDDMDFSKLPFFEELTFTNSSGKLYDAKNLKELRHEYKKLALLHHPDKGGDVEKFKKILEVYENLEKYFIKS